MIARLTSTSALCLASLLGACVPSNPVGTPADSDHTWQIVGHHVPGRTIAPDAASRALHGAFVHLRAERATTAGETCDGPVYATSTHAAAAYLAATYGLPPSALGVPDAAAVHVIDVTCEGTPWGQPGGRVLSFGDAGEFAVRDGVFFRLRRVYL